jgi:DNA helicase II / ATP-dependent DNA helicase PcrA
MPAHVLDGLDPEQRLVAEALTGPVVVLAGAGTGKTRAITHRIAHAVHTGTHAAGNGLAVTFTNRAAGEMRQRLGGLGVQAVPVRTFHAAALSQLRYFWPTAVGGQFPDLVSSKAAMVGQACREIGLPSGRPLVRDLAAEIEWAGSTMVSAGDYATAAAAAGRMPVGSGEGAIDLPGIARVMSAYQDVKSQAGAIDFEDVLLLMVALIGDRPDIADVIRSQYRWFTVDEYQDITPAQDRLLSGWLGDRDDVCVVGDASQTIYSFAGASPDALGQFARRWPNATEVRLDRCYRCTPEIVAVANSVIRSAAVGGPGVAAAVGRPAVGAAVGTAEGVGPAQGRGPGTAVWLRSQRASGVAPEIVQCADDVEEAASVAARITDLVASGLTHRDIAILMRTNAASEPIEVALAEANIPYVLRGAERFFDRPEVREAIVRMRGHAVAGGGRREKGPAKGTSTPSTSSPAPPAPAAPQSGQAELDVAGSAPTARSTTADAANGLVEQTHAVLAGMGWLSTGPASGGATRERWESLAAVLALAEEVSASGRSTMSELVEEFERRAQLSHAPTADGVTVTTLHSAKGLEWPVVFIIGAAEGNLPIVYADTQARIEEERRLFYVGVTRARDRLVVTWSLTRPGSLRHRQASRFLASMRTRGATGGESAAAGLVRQGRSAAARDWSGQQPPERCRVCGAGLVTGRERTLGRCLKCPGTRDERLATSLRDWRDAEAQGRGLPASIVLTDETLAAVEERRPATESDLRDIPGFRPDKIASYGSQVLALVASFGDPAGAHPTEETGGDEEIIDVRAMAGAESEAREAVSAPPDDPGSV